MVKAQSMQSLSYYYLVCVMRRPLYSYLRFPPTLLCISSKSRTPCSSTLRSKIMLDITRIILLLLCISFPLLAEAQRPKILCLHGGGGSANSFSTEIATLENALPEYEFVYATGAYGSGNNRLWIDDPPGGKGDPTTDPNWADASIQALDNVRAQGAISFYGILGYSQGAAFVPVYLSRVPAGTFQIAITFCGYLTTTHLGILGTVEERSPFDDIPHMVWMGGQDYIISNEMTMEMSEKFTNPEIVTSANSGHVVPGSSDPTFDEVVGWIRGGAASSPTEAPVQTSYSTSSPTEAPVQTSDSTSYPTEAPVQTSDSTALCSDLWKMRCRLILGLVLALAVFMLH
jgi:predicted esterase